jgi:hypothetical protein
MWPPFSSVTRTARIEVLNEHGRYEGFGDDGFACRWTVRSADDLNATV